MIVSLIAFPEAADIRMEVCRSLLIKKTFAVPVFITRCVTILLRLEQYKIRVR